MITSLRLQNLRCFADTGSCDLAPLTFLIGENSSGKSTFLAAIRILHDIAAGRWKNVFNEPPFQWGSYNEIACYRGGKFGRAKGFELTGSFMRDRDRGKRAQNQEDVYSVTACFTNRAGQPEVSSLRLFGQNASVTFGFSEGSALNQFDLELKDPPKSARVEPGRSMSRPPFLRELFDIGLFSATLFVEVNRAREKNEDSPAKHFTPSEMALFEDLFMSISMSTRSRPYAIAPIRTKPQRTYDPVDDTPDPEGTHIPLVLTRAAVSKTVDWASLKDKLATFGEEANLFKDIQIRKLGTSDSDPFQITVRLAGPARNIIDVGYGVSQALPVLVDTLTARSSRMFLLQQPEVHVHPRGQAALASFFLEAFLTHGHHFVVETHSDYIVDRLRYHIREKKVKPSDVKLLYFEREGIDVHIHSISFDSDANMLRVPPSFRSFFLEEERRLLGI